MHRSSLLTAAGAAVALALTPAVAVAAGRVSVTVRVEGATTTLLAPKTVTTPSGSITKDGAPSGVCPGDTAAGALDVATHHDWAGQYSATYSDYLIDSILGDTPNGKTAFWSVWVNDKYASVGVCALTLKRGDQVLFAVDSTKRYEHPLGLTAPGRATSGHAFTVKVVSYSDQGKASVLAGARVAGGGVSAVTNRKGIATIDTTRTGRVRLTATDGGHIRSAPVTVTVTVAS
jgi:hypothetical protein